MVLGIGAIVLYALGPFHKTDSLLNSEPKTSSEYTLPTDSENLTNITDLLTDFSGLESQLSTLGPFQRARSLEILLADASVDELQDCLVLVEKFQSEELRDEIQRSTIRKLATYDPRRAAESLEQIDASRATILLEMIFVEWSVSDLTEAVDYASRLNSNLKLSALRGILFGRDDLADDALLEIGAALDNKQLVMEVIASSRLNISFSNPAETWNDLLDEYGTQFDEFSDSQIELLVQVAESWLTEYDENTFREIYRSLGNDSNRVVLLTSLFEVMYDTNFESVLESAQWLNSQDRELLANMLSRWSNSDPLSALEIANATEDDSLRLKRAVLEIWNKTNPSYLLENLDQIPEDLRTWSVNDALWNMTRSTPELVPQWLDLVTDDRRRVMIESLAENWGMQDPLAALEWVNSDQFNPEDRDYYMRNLLTQVAYVDPSLALKMALEEPTDLGGVGIETMVIGSAVHADTENGIAMLEHARNPQTLDEALLQVGTVLIEKEEFERAVALSTRVSEDNQLRYFSLLGGRLTFAGDIDKAIELASHMSDDLQIQYFERIAGNWAHAEPASMLEYIKNQSSREIQSILASELASRHKIFGSLTTDQLEALEEYLPNDE